MAHLISEHDLPGIGAGRLRRLQDAGYTTLEQLVDAGAETLNEIPHLPLSVCKNAVEAAAAIVSATPASPAAPQDVPSTADTADADTADADTADADSSTAAPQVAAAADDTGKDVTPETAETTETAEAVPAPDAIDRISPTRRPSRESSGRQSWQDLLFMHWPIPVEALRPLIPKRLSIDTFDGVAYIGIVPFSMKGVQPWWAPFGLNFLETNVRTYVHLDGAEPGVWFFSLEAANWLAVQVARMGWSLPYHHAKMRLMRPPNAPLQYTTKRQDGRGAGLSVSYTVGDALGPSEPGSLEHFLLERYVLYTEKKGSLLRGRVHHSPYPAHSATVTELEDSLVSAAGLPAVEGLPPIVHYSPSVNVEVFGLEPA